MNAKKRISGRILANGSIASTFRLRVWNSHQPPMNGSMSQHLCHERHVQHTHSLRDDLTHLGGNTPVVKEFKRKLIPRFTMAGTGYVSRVAQKNRYGEVENTTPYPFWRDMAYGAMQLGAHDKGRSGDFSRSARRCAATRRSHGNRITNP